MKIDSRHLSAIEIIRRTGGLTRAAAELATSQPALSRLVADLEARLNAPLFDRGTRPWGLTKLGESLAAQGAAILRAQERATGEVARFRGGRSGVLRIAGPPFFTDGVVSRILPRFREQNPDVSFEISYGYAQDLRRVVLRGQSDLAFYPLGVGGVEPELHFTRLQEMRNVIACREGHPILRLAYPRPLALMDYDWIIPPEGSPLGQDMQTVLSRLEMQEVNIVFTGGSLASVLNYLEGSDCLAVLPETTVNAIGRLFRIQAVPIQTDTPSRIMGILSRPQDEIDAITRTFIGFMGRQFTELAN